MNITYEDFSKLDIRIGKVTAVEKVPETDRLLKFEFDFGDQQRTIVGGWALSYPEPEVLVGTLMPVLVNLEPRTIKGIVSQGMILSAVSDDLPIALHPEKAVELGSLVK